MTKQHWNTSRIVDELLRCGWRDITIAREDKGLMYRDRLYITAKYNINRKYRYIPSTFNHYVYDNTLYQ